MKILRLDFYQLKRRIIKSYYWRDKIPYLLGLKKAESGSMPDFIIAGLPKCGTVWLVKALQSDSNFEYIENPFLKNKGEIRFFSINFNQPLSKYLFAFKNRRGSGDKLLFEKSPDYSKMSIWRLRLIKKLNPSIKIILLFRNPIERLYSNAKMDLIRKDKIEMKAENDHLFFKNYKSKIGEYDYHRIINNWLSVFNKSQIIILSMEDIRDNPEEVLLNIYTFLNRNFFNEYEEADKPENVTRSSPLPDSHRAYLRKNFASTIEYWENNQSLFRLKYKEV